MLTIEILFTDLKGKMHEMIRVQILFNAAE